MIVNAENQILGRMTTEIVKKLKENEEVIVINAEKAVISGDRDMIFEEFRKRRERGQRYFGPFYPRMPDRIIKRTIRGMLPKRKKWGRNALKNLKVFIGVPEGIDASNAVKFDNADLSRLKLRKYVKLEEISRHLGGMK